MFSQNKGAFPLGTIANQSTSESTYAVVVGISDYQDPAIPDLRFADKDAVAFANYLRSDAGGKLDNDHLKVLINGQATSAQFASALDWMLEVVKENDQAILYFSGHGDVERKTITQPGYLLCWDAPSRVYLGGGALALPMLQDIISTLSTQNKAKVIVVTDACRSGKLAGSIVGGSQITGANLAKQYANEIKILSCQPNEYSIEGEQWGGGRGAFSYHLVNALYGMADNNNDREVSLQETGRYLEDHVSAEVAPVSQVPMVLGNRMERLAKVDVDLLASLRRGNNNLVASLSSIESRGIEEEVLAQLDTNLRMKYQLFRKSIVDKKLLEPANACADIYYEELIKEPALQRLHTTMTRNYAAALQDDAQQVINIWLSADVQQLNCIGKSIRLKPIPMQLRRASQLLGANHYMFRSLQAREQYFEGVLLRRHENPEKNLGQACLALFMKAADLEPQSPLPWHQMCQVYLVNKRQVDSAFICARKARELSPNWVLPFVDLANDLIQEGKLMGAKQALEEAEKIDPDHPYVINRWANWYYHQKGKENLQKALSLFEKYQNRGGPVYPCWYNDFAIILSRFGRYEEAEEMLNKARVMDSTKISVLTSLGRLYIDTKRFEEGEAILHKALSIDSLKLQIWTELGYLYKYTKRYDQFEQAFKKAISLDSTDWYFPDFLGSFYLETKRYKEAELYLKKAISLDSSIVFTANNLGMIYLLTGRYAEAEPLLRKAIQLDSTEVNPYNNLGSLLLKLHRYDESEKFLLLAIGRDSTHFKARKHLGMVYLKTNRLEEARQSFLKSLSIKPNHTNALLGMAYLLDAERKEQEALLYVEQAIAIGTTLEELEKDEDLSSLRSKPAWKTLMKKYFLDK